MLKEKFVPQVVGIHCMVSQMFCQLIKHSSPVCIFISLKFLAFLITVRGL
jgi:hypothetical protein